MIGLLIIVFLMPALLIVCAFAILYKTPGGKRFFLACLSILAVINFVHVTFFQGVRGLDNFLFFIPACYMELLLFIVVAAVYSGNKGKSRENGPRF